MVMNVKKQSWSVRLGQSEVEVSPLGIGTWAWGDALYWGRWNRDDLRAAFETSVAAGVNLFDTAEIYGMGQSEKLVGEFMHNNSKLVVATKFFPFPWRFFRGNLLAAARGSLKHLAVRQIDLYQIHYPIPPMPIDTWVAAMADAVEAGLVKLVGVSNYTARQTRRAHLLLSRHNIPLTSNQVQYSLLARGPERSGLLQTCRELGVTLIAYSPLAQGVLSGKYTPDHPLPGVRGWRYSRGYLRRVQPLISLLREIGQGHGGKTPAQVAINWTICKGALPIPGVRNKRQAEESIGALGWMLTQDEMAALDSASDKL